ncbi:MAG: GNAT family N-acetyltransferase [Methylococcaceae bacterium]|nr:GNAT family N-acetyltransferase [Methylococcaceae bacterium]
MDYRVYLPGIDEALVVELRGQVWGKDHPHTDSQFLQWILHATPLGDGTGILMSDNGTTVGFMGISPRLIVHDGKEYRAGHCMDLMVHPDFRSTLSSLRLVTECLETMKNLGYNCAYGFPNNNSYRLVTSPRCGYKWIFSPSLMVRPIGNDSVSEDLAAWLPRLFRKLAGQALTSACSVWAACAISKKPVGEVCLIDSFDARFDDFWLKSQKRSGISFKQDSAYLNWRFVGHPIYEYHKLAWLDGNEVKGYLITTKRELLGVPTTLIVDMLTINNDSGIIRELVKSALQVAIGDGSQLIATQLLSTSSNYKLLKKLGFISVPQKFNPKQFNFVLHDLGQDATILHNSQPWSFVWCDMDIV